MYKLFIDTHYLDVIVILFKGNMIVDKVELINTKSHSIVLMPCVDKLLTKNNISIKEIDEYIVCNGPGSFTGVRLGVTVAKMLAYMNNKPIKAISSLQVIASNCSQNNFVVYFEENNGYYVAEFKNDFLSPKYDYIKKSELVTYVTNKEVFATENIDYELMIKKCAILDYTDAHLVNPLYIKKIEVQNDKKSKVN